MVDFGGWDMPVHYSSQIEEHHAVRRAAGVFDVSHMCVDRSARARACAPSCSTCSPTTSRKLKTPGKALYSCMLNESRRRPRRPDRLLPRANLVPHGRECRHARQGPRLDPRATRRPSTSRSASARIWRCSPCRARRRARKVGAAADAAQARSGARARALRRARARRLVRRAHRLHRRGRLRDHAAGRAMRCASWRSLNALGVASCGLGARDTLRLEAGMNLYGNDMDESTHPARVGARLDRGVRAARARTSSAATALEAVQRRRLRRASWSACCSKIAACCAATRRWWRRCGRGRDHQRHVLPDARALHRLRARARGTGGRGAGRYPRQAPERARGEAAVRALRPID